MPVSFLTNVQKQCYGRYTDEPTIAQLHQYTYCISRRNLRDGMYLRVR